MAVTVQCGGYDTFSGLSGSPATVWAAQLLIMLHPLSRLAGRDAGDGRDTLWWVRHFRGGSGMRGEARVKGTAHDGLSPSP